MPDRRQHRGPHPQDRALFEHAHHEVLRTAVEEYSWLLSRGYAMTSALKLVGDRYQLAGRQRAAVKRSACSDEQLCKRAQSRVLFDADAIFESVCIDSFNLLITIESALSGGVVLRGRDGCCRDLASVHGSYRRVQETRDAIVLVADCLHQRGVRRTRWLLDRPVSNSGRLRALIEQLLLEHPLEGEAVLADRVDPLLVQAQCPVISSDGWVLDRASRWVSLASLLIEELGPDVWLVDLRSTEEDGNKTV